MEWGIAGEKDGLSKKGGWMVDGGWLRKTIWGFSRDKTQSVKKDDRITRTVCGVEKKQRVAELLSLRGASSQ
jgi:hypothetical protein